jgi:uncharacterized membrane protein YidH (DUF202 family)
MTSSGETATHTAHPGDPGLAIERTRLAWNRSALGVATAAAFTLRFGEEIGVPLLGYVGAGALVAVALRMWAYASVTHRRHLHRFGGDHVLAKPRALRSVAFATTLTAVVAFFLSLFSVR